MTAEKSSQESWYDVIIVGAGLAGIYMLYRMRKLGLKAKVFEAGNGVGGTWFWNRYPGARVDIPSVEYSYQFSEELQQEWEWTERFASQAEILKYINHVADKFGLRSDIQLNTRVVSATFNENSISWSVVTSDGQTARAQYCIMATGILSSPLEPQIKGLNSFKGRTFRTPTWPDEKVDFSGRRVGVIGTGSSALQLIPIVGQEAKELNVFQRTPVYAVPANNRPLEEKELSKVKSDYGALRKRASQNYFSMDLRFANSSTFQVSEEERLREYEKFWNEGGFGYLYAFNDLFFSKDANETAAEFARNKIRELVHDPKVAAQLTPDYVLGCKRLCLENGYFEAFNRPNVHLIDIKISPIVEITANAVKTEQHDFELDDLILATGFDAFTGSLGKIDIKGKGSVSLREKWSEGARTYLGMATAGFPNFFIITGPGSPSVLANVIPAIEQHVEWISDCISTMRRNGNTCIEASEIAEITWMDHVSVMANETLFPTCNSWYLGANIPGKPRVFMPYVGGYPAYALKCADIAANGYVGFNFSGAPIRLAAGE